MCNQLMNNAKKDPDAYNDDVKKCLKEWLRARNSD
jgi:hypothetical protein